MQKLLTEWAELMNSMPIPDFTDATDYVLPWLVSDGAICMFVVTI